MARLLWLPEVLRAAGLAVHEVIGWERRGADSFGPVRGITCHATAGSRSSTDAGEIHTLLHGSETAPPPIAQLYLSRTGHWHVVASGTCFHNKVGWAGPNEGYGNDNLLGIEAQNDNRGEPWSAHMLDSYQRGVAALCRKLGIPASRVAAHREHQPGNKTDPHGISMTAFRARVAALLTGETEEDPLMALSERDQESLIWRVEGLVAGRATVAGGPTKGEAIVPNVKLAALERAAADEKTRDALLRGQLVADLTPPLVAALRDMAVDVPAEQIQAAVEEVVGRARLTVDPQG